MFKPTLNTVLSATISIGLMLPGLLWAQQPSDEYPLCKPMPTPDIQATPKQQLEVEAGKAEIQADGKSKLSGNVTIRQGSRIMQAGEAVYDAKNQIIELHGQIIYTDPNIQIKSQSLTYNHKDKTGEFSQSEYLLFSRHMRGMAERILQQDENTIAISQLSFTTCDKDNEAWKFKSRELLIDNHEQIGVARGNILYIRNFPVFYIPYLRFATDDNRLTGMLPPEMRYNPSDQNFTLGLPLYWNLAPNYDITLTPTFMTRRGTMLDSEFRYLTPRSRGTLDFEYLYYDPLYGDTRWYGTYKHRSQLSPNWSFSTDVNGVSDPNYLQDTDRGFTGLDAFYKRELVLNYVGKNHLFNASMLTYQVLDGNPLYSQLPGLTLVSDFQRRPNAAHWTYAVSLHNYTSSSLPSTGSRSHLELHYDYEHSSQSYYLRPALGLYMTHYELSNPSLTTSRVIPSLSLDSGLFFERQGRLFQRRTTQTLEPRLFYLYVPYQDQSAIPSFDTVSAETDFDSLFRLNRYNGIDRIGDSHHIALGLTSRFLGNHNGREYLRFSVGQIFYLADRQVTIPPEVAQTTTQSEFVSEISIGLQDGWQLLSNLWWDPSQNYSRQGSVRLQYRGERDTIFNIENRYLYSSPGTAEARTFTVSGIHSFATQWHLYSYMSYDLDLNDVRDGYFGVGYDSCCWSTRLFMRRYYNDVAAPANTGIYFEFTLKGLTGVGRKKNDALLQSSLPGYQPK